MNTTPTIKVTEDGPVVGVATARLLLQNALDREEEEGGGEAAELARKLAVNAHTGASVHVPPKDHAIPVWDMSPKVADPVEPTLTAEDGTPITTELEGEKPNVVIKKTAKPKQ
jgi:hypothetical protein